MYLLHVSPLSYRCLKLYLKIYLFWLKELVLVKIEMHPLQEKKKNLCNGHFTVRKCIPPSFLLIKLPTAGDLEWLVWKLASGKLEAQSYGTALADLGGTSGGQRHWNVSPTKEIKEGTKLENRV